MTAAAFADLVQARPLGRGRWQARCPAHPDHFPSLVIKEGREGRVLVRCWAGCELRAVLASLSLTMRDLFNDAPADPHAIANARRARSEREAAERERATMERRLGDIYRRLGFAADSLGARLAHAPEGDERWTALFHTALRWRQTAEQGFSHA